MDSEPAGLRCFLIRINPKLISNEKEAYQIFADAKE